MISAGSKKLLPIGILLLFESVTWAQCPVKTIILKGRVENARVGDKVRVELVYPKKKPGESGEVTVEDGVFRIPIEFVTEQSSILRNLPKRCGRKPETVVVTLLSSDHESAQVSLDFARKFELADPSAYTLHSELVLKGR
jgi:hypothetical protein